MQKCNNLLDIIDTYSKIVGVGAVYDCPCGERTGIKLDNDKTEEVK